jgi:hypothetical protein
MDLTFLIYLLIKCMQSKDYDTGLCKDHDPLFKYDR